MRVEHFKLPTKSLKGVGKGLSSGMKKAGGALKNQGKKASDLMKSSGSKLADISKTYGGKALDFAKNNKTALAITAIAGATLGPNIIQRLQDGESLDEALIGAPADVANKVRDQVADVAKETIEDVGDVTETAIEETSDVAQTAIEETGEVATTATDTVGDVAGNILNKFWPAIIGSVVVSIIAVIIMSMLK